MIRSIAITVVVLAMSGFLFVQIFQNSNVVHIGRSAYNVRVISVAVSRYQIHGVNLLGNNFTTFQVGPDDGPDILFDTRKGGGNPRRHQLGYVSPGAMNRYYIPC